MHTEIWIKTSFIGWHCWPEAPEQVQYLRAVHRHVFGVKVGFRVDHDDRELEFHIEKAHINVLLSESIKQKLLPPSGEYALPTYSCEQIAKMIANEYDSRHGKVKFAFGQELSRILYVEVDEDGECGSRYQHTTIG